MLIVPEPPTDQPVRPTLRAIALTVPEVAQELKLGPEQTERISAMIAEHVKGMEHLRARIGNAMKDGAPEQAREMRQKLASEQAKRLRELNRRILGLMGTEQRPAAARILGLDAPTDRATDRPTDRPKATPVRRAKT